MRPTLGPGAEPPPLLASCKNVAERETERAAPGPARPMPGAGKILTSLKLPQLAAPATLAESELVFNEETLPSLPSH